MNKLLLRMMLPVRLQLVFALLMGLVGCRPSAPPPEAMEVQRRQWEAERQAAIDQAESSFPCFKNPRFPGYEHRSSEPYTRDELDALSAVYEKLVMTRLIWHVTPMNAPKPSVIAVGLRVPFKEAFAPTTEFLDAISTHTTRAIAWQKNLDYQIPRCTLELRSWLSPDSAYVIAEVSRSGLTGRGAVAVRDGSHWKVCPTEWIMQD